MTVRFPEPITVPPSDTKAPSTHSEVDGDEVFLEYDFKTHRFSDYERHTEVGQLIKKLHDIEKEHAEQYNKQTLTRNNKEKKC